MYVKWSQDQYTRCNVSKIERKKNIHTSPHYIPQYTLPLTKISYTNPPPMSITTLISKTTSPFCHEWQRVRVSSKHLVSTERASISIHIIIIVLGCLKKRRGRLHKATKASLLSSNTANMGVHLTQLITESVEVSIHALKLRHDCIESHTIHRGRESGGGWSWKSGTSCRPRPPWT